MKVTNLITPQILSDIDDLNRKCHAMHLPSPPVQFFNIEVCDSDGSVVEKYKSKSNSWVRNAYNVLSQLFLPCDNYQGSATFGVGSQAMKDTTGTTRRTASTVTTPLYSGTADLYNNAANADFGILVGSGDTAESFESTGLATPILHGTTSGKLSYSASTNPITSYDSGAKKWTSAMTRVLTNASGASITVKEIGLAYRLQYGGGNSAFFLMSRDVLATPVTVANGQTLTITYTSEITYPA